MCTLSPPPDPVWLCLVLSRWLQVTTSSSLRDGSKRPSQLSLSSALGTIRQRDSSALKDAVRMNNKVLLLLSTALGAALTSSCWKIPAQQPEELEKGQPDINRLEGSQGTPGQNANRDKGVCLANV